jgi:hypothetical protein
VIRSVWWKSSSFYSDLLRLLGHIMVGLFTNVLEALAAFIFKAMWLKADLVIIFVSMETDSWNKGLMHVNTLQWIRQYLTAHFITFHFGFYAVEESKFPLHFILVLFCSHLWTDIHSGLSLTQCSLNHPFPLVSSVTVIIIIKSSVKLFYFLYECICCLLIIFLSIHQISFFWFGFK